MKRFLAFFIACLPSLVFAGSVSLFTPVPSEKNYPRGIETSKMYRVLVKSASDKSNWNAKTHQTASYKLWPDYLDPETLPAKHAKTAVHVAQVDADERIRVRVELIDGRKINTLRLKPTRLKEMEKTQRYGKNWIEFEVNPYKLSRHILVEVNAPKDDTDVLDDGLMFFLNPISKVPQGNILHLPSGVINESSPYMDKLNRILVDDKSPFDGIYIPQDTIIDGRIDIRKASFSVTGRGMIIGSRWPFVKSFPNWRKGYPDYISPDGEIIKPLLSYKNKNNKNSYFEGVLIAHPYHFCVGSAYINENLKTFGWRFSSDGVHGHTKRGIFTRVNDDAMYVADGNIEDATVWGMVNGAAFQFGWGLRGDNSNNVHVKRVDIVRGEWDNTVDEGIDQLGSPKNAPKANVKTVSANRGVFAATYRSGQNYTVSNKHFEDIRVDAQVNRLFYIGSRSGEVNYKNIVFKDIWFEKKPTYEKVNNVLEGKKFVDNIIFENFMVNGKHLKSIEDLQPISKKNLTNIQFK